MFTITQLEEHLTGMGHGSTLKKVVNRYALYERAASKFLAKAKPLETVRNATLSSLVWDDVYNYALPSDYNALIDLAPQADRDSWDKAFRRGAGQFDREKAIREKTISIEGSEGTKTLRINWRTKHPKVLNSLDSLTANGTWSVVGSATGLAADAIYKVSGSASVKFNLVTSGDGIQNTTMSQVDLTDEDEVGDLFAWIYLPSAPTSISLIWGNDLTTNYWTAVAQTAQADGTSFKVGWNLIRFPWSTATETGTVNPATIDSLKLTVANSAALNSIRVDSIVCALGKAFDIKYYTKFLFKNSSGTYISKPTSSDDYVLVDNDSLPLYLYECLKEMAHQMEGTDSAFDIQYARQELSELYPAFRSEYSDQRVKQASSYSSGPRMRRSTRRW